MGEVNQEEQKNPATRAGRGWIWIVAPVATFLVLVALILSTGQPSAASLMKGAASSFGEVSRGNFQFAITITPAGSAAATPSTIELSGPFELVPGKPLPRARITYTISAGGRSQEVVLLTTGDKAYTVIKGQAYELPATAAKELVKATKDLSEGDGKAKGGGLTGINLNFDKWLIDPQVAAGDDINGTPTWRTTADVDVVEAVKDLTGSLGTLGAVTGQQVPALKPEQVKDIKEQIKDASVVVYVGRYDRIVWLMDLTMTFKTPESAAAETGGISGGKMNMRVGISEPNQPVDVEPPKNPLPYSALQSLANSTSSQGGTALDDGLGR